MLNGRLLSLVLVAATAFVAPAQADTLAVGNWVNLDDAPGANASGGGGAFILNGPGSAIPGSRSASRAPRP